MNGISALIRKDRRAGFLSSKGGFKKMDIHKPGMDPPQIVIVPAR